MQRIHLLLAPSSEKPTEAFAPLIHAVEADGGRVGLLLWHPLAASVDPPLATTAASGLLRSVQVNAAGSVVHKPRKGPAVLRDVVREHFRGCRVVLVVGEPVAELAEVPRITPKGDAFQLESGSSKRQFDPAALAAWLRRPAPPP